MKSYFLLIWAATLGAQENVFRTRTQLVEVPVVVVDKSGTAVTGLTKSDFEIVDEGKIRPLAFFQFEGRAEAQSTASGETLSQKRNLFSNRFDPGSTEGPSRNLTAVLFDGLNTSPGDQLRVKKQLIAYMRRIEPSTRMALFHLGRDLRVIHDFTEDFDSFRAELNRTPTELPARGKMDMAELAKEYQQMVADMQRGNNLPDGMIQALRDSLEKEQISAEFLRTNRVLFTLSALDALGRHLSAIPGRKNLIWISAGLPNLLITGTGMGPGGATLSFTGELAAAAERLGARGISLYLVDARGLVVPQEMVNYFDPKTYQYFQGIENNKRLSNDPRISMAMMAGITGGRVFTSNDVTDALKRSDSDMRGAYTLAFYVPEQDDGRYHRIRVRTTRPELRVLHQRGYQLSTPVPEVEWSESTWRSLIASPFGSPAIQMKAQVDRAATDGTLSLNLLIDTAGLSFHKNPAGSVTADLEVCVADVTPSGRARFRTEATRLELTRERLRLAEISGIPYQRRWTHEPGASKIRVVVRDRSNNRYGILDIPLARIEAGN